MAYKFFDKTPQVVVLIMNNCLKNYTNQLLENFKKTLKNKIYKHLTSISKNVYIDKLDDIVNKYNIIYHRTIKMKPVDVKGDTYIDSGKEVNEKGPKFKVDDYVIMSKYKNIFAQGYTKNCSEEAFVINKIKNTVPWTSVINDLNGKETIDTLKKNCRKQIKKNLELKK